MLLVEGQSRPTRGPGSSQAQRRPPEVSLLLRNMELHLVVQYSVSLCARHLIVAARRALQSSMAHLVHHRPLDKLYSATFCVLVCVSGHTLL